MNKVIDKAIGRGNRQAMKKVIYNAIERRIGKTTNKALGRGNRQAMKRVLTKERNNV